MTPSQLDHLRRIDAHLAKLLENAGKRTPGEWQASPDYSAFVNMSSSRTINARLHQDAAFIASCAGNAEAGWESTREMLRILFAAESSPASFGNYTIKLMAESILAAWPLELLANS